MDEGSPKAENIAEQNAEESGFDREKSPKLTKPNMMAAP